MRRIVVIAGSMSGVKAATRIKRRLPEHEINVIVPAAAAVSPDASHPGPAQRRYQNGLPSLELLGTREVAVLEANDIMPDLEKKEITLSSNRGNITIRYSDLLVEVPATVRLPRAIQRAENVFGWPMSGFSANPDKLDAALAEAVEQKRPVVVVGNGMPALDAVCLAAESGASVHWLRTGELTVPDLDQHLLALALKSFGERVQCQNLPETLPETLGFTLADGGRLDGITLPDGGHLATAVCLWTFPLMGRHPLLREDGITLDASGRILCSEETRDSLHVYLMGSGAALPDTVLAPSGVTLPGLPGAEDSPEIGGWLAVDAISGKEPCCRQNGSLDLWSAIAPGMRAWRAGLGIAEAERLGRQADRAVASLALDADSRLTLVLLCDTDSRSLLGVQALGTGPGAAAIDGVFSAALADFAQGTPLEAIIRRGQAGIPGALLNQAARMLSNRLDSVIKGISPDELLASKAAGAEFFTLDLRALPDWRAGHVADAYNIPLPQLKKRLQGEVPHFTPILLISGDGTDAYASACHLATLGATDLYVLDGGMELWPYDTITG